MKLLQYLASNINLCKRAVDSKPDSWDDCKWFKFYAKKTIQSKNDYNENNITFDPWCFIAGFPETKNEFWENNTLNEDKVCCAFISFGYSINVEINRLNICNTIARFLLDLSDKNVFLIGNSPNVLETISKLNIQQNDIVICFNKGSSFLEHHLPHINYTFSNNLDTHTSQILPFVQNTTDIHDLYTKNNTKTLSSGLITSLWIIHNSKYSSLNILGFDMSSPGTKANFYNEDLIPYPTEIFKGYDFEYEHYLLNVFQETTHFNTFIY